MADETTQAQAAEINDEATVDTAAQPDTTQAQEAEAPTLDNISLDELDALADQLAKDEEPSNTKPEVKEQAKAEPATKEEEEEKEDKDEDSTDEDAEDNEAKAPKRVRLTALADQERSLVSTAIRMVDEGLAGNFTEAYQRLTGTTPTAQEQAKAEPQEQQEEQVPKTEAIKSEILEIKKALKAAEDEFDSEKKFDLLEALADAKAELRLEEYKTQIQAEREQETAQSAFDTTYAEARDRANELYPDGKDPQSEFAREIRATLDDFNKTNPAIFNSPNYPLAVAGMVAAKLGIAPVTAKAATPKAAPKQSTSVPVPKVAARPASPVVGGNATTTHDAASIEQMLESLSPDDLDALANAAL